MHGIIKYRMLQKKNTTDATAATEKDTKSLSK